MVGKQALVKASGGVRTYQDAIAMINAGAARIGASAGVSIVESSTSSASSTTGAQTGY